MPTVEEDAARRRKEDARLRHVLYPATSFSAGTWMSYFSTYTAMLYTDVYMLPVVLAGLLDLVSEFTRWIAGPIWGTVIDRVTLKQGKYWPWVIFGSLTCAAVYIVTYGLPLWSSNPAGLASMVFVLEVLLALASIILSTTLVSVYPRLADTPKDRTLLAMLSTIGRTGAKTIFGFLVPIMVVYFTKVGGSDQAGWASVGYIMGIAGLTFYLLFGFALRRSSIEREAIAARAKPRTRRASLLSTFKSVVTNGPLLVIFLVFTTQKIYDLGLQTNGASYFWKYYMNSFSSMSTFMAFRSLSHVLGAACGLIWLKMLKDSKRAFYTAAMLQTMMLGISTLLVGKVSAVGITLLLAASQFCIGLTEAFVLPFFAAACDYARLRTRIRAEGLTMSLYAITLTLAGMLGTIIRAGMLQAVGYNPAQYAKGVAPTQAVLTQIGRLMTMYPFLLSIVVIVLFAFYPINDKKLLEIKEALRLRDKADGQVSPLPDKPSDESDEADT